MTKTIFITGGTGNIGGKLITHILREEPDTRIAALVRGGSDEEARGRLFRVLALLAPEMDQRQFRERVAVLAGDITLERFGISEDRFLALAAEVTHIIHSAAATKFNLPMDVIRAVNVGGTVNVMALAVQAKRTGQLRGVAHVSTAFICGKRDGVIDEDGLDPAPRLSNTYEKTKWEAEKYVRGLLFTLPITIFRPSIVVGDSVTGRTTVFNVLYAPIKWMHQGRLRTIPASPLGPLDVVPVDFVAAAIHHIFLRTGQGEGRTYHLAAGEGNSTTVGEVVALAAGYFNNREPGAFPARVRFLSPLVARGLAILLPGGVKKSLDQMRDFEPYIRPRRVFDTSRATQALAGSGIRPPRLAGYFSNLLDFCVTARWSRDPAGVR